MISFEVKFLTHHESYNGHEICDGWMTYKVKARNGESAEKKAIKLWKKRFRGAPYYIEAASITEHLVVGFDPIVMLQCPIKIQNEGN